MSLDPDTMDEDSFREGLELMEQLEVSVLHPKQTSKANPELWPWIWAASARVSS